MRIKKLYYILIISLILFLNTRLFAEEKQSDKERLAVLDFNAYNCPKHLAKLTTDIISSRVFSTGIFTLIEREQIDRVMREMELQQAGCTEAGCAVEVGKLLSANKIITGTLHRLDNYIVVMKIINVMDGKIEGNYRAESEDEAHINEAVLDIVDSISRLHMTGTYFSFSLTGGYRRAAGDFSKITGNGYGTSLNLHMNNFLFRDMVLTLTTGFSSFTPAQGSIDSIMTVPAIISLGYLYHITRKIEIIPSLGGGYLVNMMNYDLDGIDRYGKYEYSRKNYYDPALVAKIDLNMALVSSIHLLVSPSYTYFFENSSAGQIIAADIGVRMFF